jgi:hypothetical protein
MSIQSLGPLPLLAGSVGPLDDPGNNPSMYVRFANAVLVGSEIQYREACFVP